MVRRTLRLAFIAGMLTTGCNSLFGIHQGTPRPICGDPNVIDDMEDGDAIICQSNGRNGVWYTAGDHTSDDLEPGPDFSPTRIADGSQGTSQYAARFTGSGFTDWGALMGFNLSVHDDAVGMVDVSADAGIKFRMRSNVPVSVNFLTPETVELLYGGQCTDGMIASNCDNHLSFEITVPGSGWVDYQVPFSALQQQRPGPVKWNGRNLYGIQFLVPPGAPFDVWVDDVGFYGGCPILGCAPTCTDPALPLGCPASDRHRAACVPPGDCAAVATWCVDPLLIDDMEDGDPAICDSAGRHGRWYSAGDGTSTDVMPREGTDFFPTAIPGGRGTSHYAARLTGSGFTLWGAGMGLRLNEPEAYDASQRSGVRFWMKNNVPVTVGLPTVEAALPSQGGQCADGPGQHNCSNWFSFKITAPSSDWVEYEVPFTAFSQPGGSSPWNPSHLLNVGFSAPPYTTFDVWVDDVQFYDCAAPGCTPTCADPAFPVSCPANGGTPAGCRPPGTVCADFVPGCNASNTTVAPADGLIATFMGAGGTDIPGVVLAWGTPTPTYATDGQLHITLDAPATPTNQVLFVADRFQDCIDAADFAGVQFTISGSFSGCTLAYFTEDSVHLFDDGDPVYGSHGVGFPGARPLLKTFASGQVTSAPQTVMIPFTALAHGDPETPIDIAKVTGLGWVFFVDASTGAGTPSCVADLTIDDVRFY
jgi:hypothetical protein